MDPYLGLFLSPSSVGAAWLFPGLPTAQAREGSGTLGTVPGLTWREEHPSPTWSKALELLSPGRRLVLLLGSL